MKKYLITREQLDRVVENYLASKMMGGRILTKRNRYSKGSLMNAFVNPANEILFILFEWAESWDWDDDEGPRNVLTIDDSLISFLSKHLSVRRHKAMDIISDWFEDTYDFEFGKVESSNDLRKTFDGWDTPIEKDKSF